MKNLILTWIKSDEYPGEIEKQIHFTGQADENLNYTSALIRFIHVT